MEKRVQETREEKMAQEEREREREREVRAQEEREACERGES